MTTVATPIASAAVHVHHQHEQFTWASETWDIASLLRDIASGALRPDLQDLDREFIDTYAQQVLALDKAAGANQTRLSLLMHVSAKDALALPSDALQQPLVMLMTKKGKGLLRLDDSAGSSYVLADGNHRVARAFLDDVPRLRTFVLNARQSRKYRLD